MRKSKKSTSTISVASPLSADTRVVQIRVLPSVATHRLSSASEHLLRRAALSAGRGKIGVSSGNELAL